MPFRGGSAGFRLCEPIAPKEGWTFGLTFCNEKLRGRSAVGRPAEINVAVPTEGDIATQDRLASQCAAMYPYGP
jgi:hypothetical protein